MGRRIEALWDELGGFPGQSVFGLNGSRGSEHKAEPHIAQAGVPEPTLETAASRSVMRVVSPFVLW